MRIPLGTSFLFKPDMDFVSSFLQEQAQENRFPVLIPARVGEHTGKQVPGLDPCKGRRTVADDQIFGHGHLLSVNYNAAGIILLQWLVATN